MDQPRFKELDPTTAIENLSVLDALIADSAPKEVKDVTQYVTPDAEHVLKNFSSVQDLLPTIRGMIEWEAANNGKKCYPRLLLRNQHIIAFLLTYPQATNAEVCRFFSIGPSVLKQIASSDAFKAMMVQYQVNFAAISPDINEQLKDTMAAAITIVQKDLVERQDPDYALQVLDKTANRLGMGTKQQTNVQINNNIVTADMIAQARAAHQRRLENNGG